MSNLLKTLNLKKSDKVVKNNNTLSIEAQLNKLFKNACIEAIKNDEELKKYYVEDLPKTDVFKQVKSDEIELSTISGDVIAIPCEDVELTNGKKSHTLDTAYRVGTIQTYIGGVKKQVVEYIKTS